MDDYFNTVELERSFLKLIVKSKMHANLNIHKGRDEYFTNEARKFIFKLAKDAYSNNKSTLTKDLFDYELAHKVDQKDSVYFESEWEIISNLDVVTSVEAMVDRLIEADAGRKLMASMEDSLELIAKGEVSKALSNIKTDTMQISMAKDNEPIRRLIDYERRLEIISDKKKNPEKYSGLKTGIFPTFDKKTGGFFKGELTLIAGVTGLGKSTLVKALEWGILSTNPNINILHIANEEYSLQVENKFDALITEIPYLDFKFGNITDKDLETWKSKMKELRAKSDMGFGEIYTKEVPAFTDVTLVEQAYRELEAKGIKIDLIMIDHLPHIVPIMKSYGENDERFKAAADCKELARSLKVPVVIPTQAATEVEQKQNSGKRAGKLDVYGSKGQVHVANTFLIITSAGKDNTQVDRPEYERDVYWLVDCKKNRDGSSFSFKAKHHVYFGKVEEISEGGFTGSGEYKADEDVKNEANSILDDLNERMSDGESQKDRIEEEVDKSPSQGLRSRGMPSAIKRIKSRKVIR